MNTSSAAIPSAQTIKRCWSLDLLRALATYGVVVLHMSPLPEGYSSIDSLPWQIVTAIGILFRWCVPAFMMMSGALFLAPEKAFSVSKLYKKSILRIVTCFIFWSALYAVAHCVHTGKGKWTFMNQFLRGHYHMWYVFAILGLYMLTPFLRKLTENRKLTEYFLLLAFIFVFLLPRLLGFLQIFPLPHADVIASARSAVTQINPLPNGCALFYFVLGHYLHTYPLEKKLCRLLIPAGLVGFIMTVALTSWHTGLLEERSAYFYDMTSLTVLLMVISVFLLFQYAFADYHPSQRMQHLLITLTQCSFGVYLVHPFLIERLQLTLPLSPVILLLGTPLLSLAIYLLSLAISYLLHRIPVIGKHIV